MTLALTRLTVQEGAASCGFNANIASPSIGEIRAAYTDINGFPLVGYFPTLKSSSASTALVATADTNGAANQSVVTMFHPDSSQTAGSDLYCGEAAGTATMSATSAPGEMSGASSPCVSGITNTCFTRTAVLTVTGVPATIALTASPPAIPCDGTSTSTVTAKVTDSAGNNVVDGTAVTFSVVALGTANPINTTTTGGTARSVITPLENGESGVAVTVTSGAAGFTDQHRLHDGARER